MFDFLASLVEELTCIHLYQYADLGPDVTFVRPVLAIKNDFRSTILTRIDYRVMLFVVISSSAKVNYFDGII